MVNKAKKELEKLLKGNENFVSGNPQAVTKSLETLQKFEKYQAPFAVVLTCSDSRVVPEIIFDCGIGELFVVRVAGMTTGPNVVESLEYAVKKLHLPLLMLLGHDDCGVMKFAEENYPNVTENFKAFANCVYPVLDNYGPATDSSDFAKKHTLWVEKFLLEHSKIIRQAVENGELYIAKCHFNHSTGKVELID